MDSYKYICSKCGQFDYNLKITEDKANLGKELQECVDSFGRDLKDAMNGIKPEPTNKDKDSE